jgi:hypothetical protein
MRRTVAVVITASLIPLLLSACGGGGGGSKKASLQGSQGVSRSAACSGKPVQGGNLVYERQAEVQTLDPLNILNGNGDIFSYNRRSPTAGRFPPTARRTRSICGRESSSPTASR